MATSLKRAAKALIGNLGYEVRRIPHSNSLKEFPAPTPDIVEAATRYFSNSFAIANGCTMTRDEIKRAIGDYFWHYSFKFDDIVADADWAPAAGRQTRPYQRYLHIFPPLLSLTKGSLQGLRVLDIACNCGFWSIQASRAGAAEVVGIDGGPKNIEQAEFLKQVIELPNVTYRTWNAYDVTREALGEYDVTFFLGLLYHLDKPVTALERLREVTRRFAVVDTTISTAPGSIAEIVEDQAHDQNHKNSVAFVPSKVAVASLLRAAGFTDVFYVPVRSDAPADYRNGSRAVYIAQV